MASTNPNYKHKQEQYENKRLARIRRNVILNGIYIVALTVLLILIFGGVIWTDLIIKIIAVPVARNPVNSHRINTPFAAAAGVLS